MQADQSLIRRRLRHWRSSPLKPMLSTILKLAMRLRPIRLPHFPAVSHSTSRTWQSNVAEQSSTVTQGSPLNQIWLSRRSCCWVFRTSRYPTKRGNAEKSRPRPGGNSFGSPSRPLPKKAGVDFRPSFATLRPWKHVTPGQRSGGQKRFPIQIGCNSQRVTPIVVSCASWLSTAFDPKSD